MESEQRQYWDNNVRHINIPLPTTQRHTDWTIMSPKSRHDIRILSSQYQAHSSPVCSVSCFFLAVFFAPGPLLPPPSPFPLLPLLPLLSHLRPSHLLRSSLPFTPPPLPTYTPTHPPILVSLTKLTLHPTWRSPRFTHRTIIVIFTWCNKDHGPLRENAHDADLVHALKRKLHSMRFAFVCLECVSSHHLSLSFRRCKNARSRL